MKRVWINPGCISCGACEFIAPEVFEVTDVSRVKPDANLDQHREQVVTAIIGCPVQVIQADE